MSTLTLMGAGPEAGGFSPAAVAGLTAWFSADVGTSTTTDGVGVSQWNDRSSGAHNAVQATGANQPLYKTAIQNGLPGILFDGSNDLLDATGIVLSQPNSSFVVLKSLTGGGSTNAIDGITTRQEIGIGPTAKWGLFAGSDVESAVAGNTSAHTISALFNGASSQEWLDGTALNPPNPGANALNGLRFGSFNGGATGSWNGYLFEIVLYSGALSTPDRQSVEGYLRTKWNTP